MAELLHLLVLVLAAVAALGAAGLAGLLAFRVRRRLEDAARAASPTFRPTETGRELPSGLHLHFHGVGAEVVQILRRQLR